MSKLTESQTYDLISNFAEALWPNREDGEHDSDEADAEADGLCLGLSVALKAFEMSLSADVIGETFTAYAKGFHAEAFVLDFTDELMDVLHQNLQLR